MKKEQTKEMKYIADISVKFIFMSKFEKIMKGDKYYNDMKEKLTNLLNKVMIGWLKEVMKKIYF